MTRTGHCLCGAVAFEAELSGTRYAACHCGMCRRWGSGPFLATEAKRVTVTEGAEQVTVFTSSDWAGRAFCASCGSNLWYELAGAEERFVSVGVLDDQSDMILAEEIFYDCKPEGYAFAGETRKMTEAEVIAAFAPESGA